MTTQRIRAERLFDGERLLEDRPRLITIEDGTITSVAAAAADVTPDVEAPFVMPGLVEAHAHIFLDGSELDAKARAGYFTADLPCMLDTARANVGKSTRCGVTLVRDAGDRYGVNHAIRDELAADPRALLALRSPGLGIKRPKRYGGFMARDIATTDEIAPTIDQMATGSDDIKIILTGIIDFEAGGVKGDPQFDRDSLGRIVAAAHHHGRKTFAHCSGLAGLEVAVDAGVDSIEHGFFMTRDILARMAERQIAWVPTFSPVHFQWARPELAGWDERTVGNLRRILDQHLAHVAIAHELGVPLVAGSDAGSQGADHGAALVDELFHFLAAGLPMDAVLRSATSRPRRLWGAPSADIAPGRRADLVALGGSPFADPQALHDVRLLVRGEARAAFARGA